METQPNLTRDFIVPTVFFATLGAMTWAVRGCSGYGGPDGCLFAGVMWGAGWWFIARDPIVLALIIWRIRTRCLPSGFPGDVFPHAYALMWLVLIVQNILAQLVTGPPTQWTERVFNVYYIILFAITVLIVVHVWREKRRTFSQNP